MFFCVLTAVSLILAKTVYNKMVDLRISRQMCVIHYAVVPPIDGCWNYDSVRESSYKTSENYTHFTAKYIPGNIFLDFTVLGYIFALFDFG